jgi:acetyltransferase-like isoleucine patch superfamily enzyme
MNKTSAAYTIIVKSMRLIGNIVKPFERIITGLKRARLFGEIGIILDSDISADLDVKYPRNIFIGKKVKIGLNCQIGAASRVIIGNGVTISEGVTIETAGLNTRVNERQHTSKEIIIEEEAWIGTRAILLGGAKIGRGSIVSAGSVVKIVVPSGHIYSNGKLIEIKKE